MLTKMSLAAIAVLLALDLDVSVGSEDNSV